MDFINVGCSSWIIQDGNYDDFAVGERHRFALEFHAPGALKRSDGQRTQMLPVLAETYDVVASVAFVADGVWVLDAGILMFKEETPPAVAAVGNRLTGRLSVGIDPFFYKEYLHSLPGMPALEYDFVIEAISIETTPWVTIRNLRQRRHGERTFRSIDKTNAWNDDDGHADYVLHCRVLALPN